MASQEHLELLKQSLQDWNRWRAKHPEVQPDLSEANLSEANLSETNLINATLSRANLSGASLSEANLRYAGLAEANLTEASLRIANLTEADLSRATLRNANLNWADLTRATLSNANLNWADLTRATLSNANLRGTTLVETNFTDAILTGCHIYGIAAWNVKLTSATQNSLVITPEDEPEITVDNLKIAQFLYLLLNNQEIRDVIDTIARKAVLILGRFTLERKAVLDALRDKLRGLDYLPILFDFEKPSSHNLTETVSTLAHLSRFIVADLTDPSSIPQELYAIAPTLAIPIQPLLEASKREYSMFSDLSHTYHWVLPIYQYTDLDTLLASFQEQIIDPAEHKAQELIKQKAQELTQQ